MNFDDAYQLLELLETDSERETYTARVKATGREVYIHLLSKKSEHIPSLLTLAERHLASQGATDSGLQLKIGTFQTEQCLITESAAELRNVRRALEQRSAPDPFEKANMWKVPAAKQPVPDNPVNTAPVGEFTSLFSRPVAPAPASSQGEFTRMFEVSPPVSPAPVVPPPAVEMPPVPVQPAPPAPLSESGAFTQMFSAPSSKSERGEITLMFENGSPAPATVPKPEAAPPVTTASDPGDFTRMFKPAGTPSPVSKENRLDFAEPPKPEAAPPVTAASDPGDFTRMFKPAGTPSPVSKENRLDFAEPPKPEAAPPVTAASDPGDFTRMFKPAGTPSPVSKENRPDFAEPPKPEAAPRVTAKSDAGDFTRMFKPDATPAPVSKENWLDFAERPQQSSSLDTINWDSPQAGATGAFAVRSTSPAEPVVSNGPSDFTRLISVPANLPPQNSNPPAAPAAQQPAAPEPSAPPASNLPIIVALNVLVIAIVALILYFLLRR